MAEWMPYLLGASAAVISGLLVYWSTRKRDTVDERAKLFDDALELATAHKDAWEKATDEIEVLRVEIEGLRREVEGLRSQVGSAIREGEMWRGVAVNAYQAEVRRTGIHPLWWPKGQPCPAESG